MKRFVVVCFNEWKYCLTKLSAPVIEQMYKKDYKVHKGAMFATFKGKMENKELNWYFLNQDVIIVLLMIIIMIDLLLKNWLQCEKNWLIYVSQQLHLSTAKYVKSMVVASIFKKWQPLQWYAFKEHI